MDGWMHGQTDGWRRLQYPQRFFKKSVGIIMHSSTSLHTYLIKMHMLSRRMGLSENLGTF